MARINFANPISSSPLNRGLVSWWPTLPQLAGGNRWLDLCGRNHCTLNTGVSWAGSGGGNGQIAAIGWDGSTGYAEAATSTSMDTSVGTWSGWFNTTQSVASNYFSLMARSGSSSLAGINLYLEQTTAKIGWQIHNGASTVNGTQTTTTGYNDGKWHHWALVWDQANAATVTLYVDGVSAATSINSNSWAFSGQVLRIGYALDTFWKRWLGKNGPVRIHDRKLSGDEVAAIRFDDMIGNRQLFNYVNARRPVNSVAAGTFQSAWALGSNVVIQPTVSA